MSDADLKREHQRAVQAENALAELRRRYTLLELRNLELSGILEALSARGRVSAPVPEQLAEQPAEQLADQHTEQDAAE